MRQRELSDEDWRLVAPLLPKQARGGRRNDHRTTLSGMLWILKDRRAVARPAGAVRALAERLRPPTCQ